MNLKRVGMVVAMQKEILPFLENSNVKIKNEMIGKYSIISFEINNKEVYIIESGVGEIFASGATQLLISKYSVDAIINFGVCGSLNNNLNLLDTVLVDGIIHYDFDLSTIDDVKIGEYPGLGQVISCKNELMDVALKINPSIQKVLCASADKFVSDEEIKNNLYNTYGTSICEMESAGVVLTCINNNIPFLVIKAVSDGKGGVTEYKEMVKRASKSYIELIYKILEEV